MMMDLVCVYNTIIDEYINKSDDFSVELVV